MIVGLLVDEVESGPERIRFEGEEGPLHVGVAGARDHLHRPQCENLQPLSMPYGGGKSKRMTYRFVRWRSWIAGEEDGERSDEEKSEHGGGKDPIRDDIT